MVAAREREPASPTHRVAPFRTDEKPSPHRAPPTDLPTTRPTRRVAILTVRHGRSRSATARYAGTRTNHLVLDLRQRHAVEHASVTDAEPILRSPQAPQSLDPAATHPGGSAPQMPLEGTPNLGTQPGGQASQLPHRTRRESLAAAIALVLEDRRDDGLRGVPDDAEKELIPVDVRAA